jgi:hypothetical protein
VPDAPLEIQTTWFRRSNAFALHPDVGLLSTTVVTSTRHSARGLLSKVLHDDPDTGRPDDGTNFFARVSTASSNHSQAGFECSLAHPDIVGSQPEPSVLTNDLRMFTPAIVIRSQCPAHHHYPFAAAAQALERLLTKPSIRVHSIS